MNSIPIRFPRRTAPSPERRRLSSAQWTITRRISLVMSVIMLIIGVIVYGVMLFAQRADADCTYDFRNLAPFVEAMRNGTEYAMGSRWKGSIERGAMPPLHRLVDKTCDGEDAGERPAEANGAVTFRVNRRDEVVAKVVLRDAGPRRTYNVRLVTRGAEGLLEMTVVKTVSTLRFGPRPHLDAKLNGDPAQLLTLLHLLHGSRTQRFTTLRSFVTAKPRSPAARD